MKREQLHIFISNVLIHYIFGAHTFVSDEVEQIKVYHRSMDDYMKWAENRIEQLFYEFDEDEPFSGGNILRLDRKLVGIFPFMERVVDRTELISDTIELFKTLSVNDSTSEPESVPPPSPELSPAPAPAPIIASAPECPSVSLSPTSEKMDPLNSVVGDFTVLPETPPHLYVPVNNVISLNQSIHKLRKAVSDIGGKSAFLLTKANATKILAKYNKGVLLYSEL